jgi:hypothetical protein
MGARWENFVVVERMKYLKYVVAVAPDNFPERLAVAPQE